MSFSPGETSAIAVNHSVMRIGCQLHTRHCIYKHKGKLHLGILLSKDAYPRWKMMDENVYLNDRNIKCVVKEVGEQDG